MATPRPGHDHGEQRRPRDWEGRLLLGAGVLSFFAAEVVVLTAPRLTGYEIEAFSPVARPLWGCLIASETLAFLLILTGTGVGSKRTAYLGLSLLIAVSLFIVALPMTRGYYFYGLWDSLTHYGFSLDILNNGFLDSVDFYPVTHIFSVTISSLLGIPLRDANELVPVLGEATFIAGMAILGSALNLDWRRRVLLAAAATLPLWGVFGAMVFPDQQAFDMVPFALYAYFGSSPSAGAGLRPHRWKFSALFAILAVFLCLSHPIVVLAVSLFLLAELVHSKILTGPRGARAPGAFVPLAILLVTFLGWFTTFAVFRVGIRVIAERLSGESGLSPVAGFLQIAAASPLSPLDEIRYVLQVSGQYLIIAGLIVFAVIRLRPRAGLTELRTNQLAGFGLAVLLWGFVTIFFTFTDFIIREPLRFGKYLSMGVLVFLSLAFPGVLRWPSIHGRQDEEQSVALPPQNTHRRRAVLICLLAFAMSAAFAIAAQDTYYSPFNASPNMQVTATEWQAMGWHLQTKKPTVPDATTYLNSSRFANAIYGYSGSPRVVTWPGFVPADFLDLNSSSPFYAGHEMYIILSSMDFEAYLAQLRPNPQPTYPQSSLMRLNGDPGVAHIYDNGDVEIWMTNLGS